MRSGGPFFAVPLVDYAHKLCIPSSTYGRPPAASKNASLPASALLPSILHESDVEAVSELLCECLGSGEIFLPPLASSSSSSSSTSGGGFSEFERSLLEPPLDVWNAFARSANRYETSLGIRVRCKDRLKFDNTAAAATATAAPAPPGKDEGGTDGGGGGGSGGGALPSFSTDGVLSAAYEPIFSLSGRRSIVLVLPDGESDDGSSSSSSSSSFAATAELALQPRDGQLPTNFPNLFERSDDGQEGEEDEGGEGGSMGSGMMGSSGSGSGSSNRNMNSAPPPQFSPYICNVAVSPKWRRLGLGMHLVRLCEQLAARQWGECVYCLIRGSVSE